MANVEIGNFTNNKKGNKHPLQDLIHLTIGFDVFYKDEYKYLPDQPNIGPYSMLNTPPYDTMDVKKKGNRADYLAMRYWIAYAYLEIHKYLENKINFNQIECTKNNLCQNSIKIMKKVINIIKDNDIGKTRGFSPKKPCNVIQGRTTGSFVPFTKSKKFEETFKTIYNKMMNDYKRKGNNNNNNSNGNSRTNAKGGGIKKKPAKKSIKKSTKKLVKKKTQKSKTVIVSGKKYVVRTGKRGGKYILRNNAKVYL
jgi:hypothetical protein